MLKQNTKKCSRETQSFKCRYWEAIWRMI